MAFHARVALMEQRATYHSQGLARGLAALRIIAENGEAMTLAALARAMDLPKSTLIRLLAVMEEQQFVRKAGEPPAYALGRSLQPIAEAYLAPEIGEVAAPVMQRLASELGFTSNLGILEGTFVLHVHVEEPPRALRFATGGSLDHTYCTGLGKMLLTTVPAADLTDHLPQEEPFEAFTPSTVTSRAELLDELDRVRKRGVSIDNEERNRGVTCMAVLIPGDMPLAVSLSISAPSGELAPPWQAACLPVLRSAAQDLADSPEFTGALLSMKKKRISVA